ncbi:hexokinase [Deltaproteobacteria bacterium]|nr:hexokinase [Deltaproteobacteria bacterium]
MDILTRANSFLKDHGMSVDDVRIYEVCENIISEMQFGLKGKKSSLEMIPTYVDVPERIKPLDPVVVIDAGGTNFRAALAQFAKSGEFQVQSTIKTVMPGAEHYLSKDEFFLAVADIVRDLMGKSDKIGFCFSYPIEIYPNRDGRLIRFVKEIKAPEVEGELIGENLLATLDVKKKIVILNDTAATLLAGKAASVTRSFSSYIGFILGTGCNGSYIESRSSIYKLKENYGHQIINTELGNFNKLHRGVIDIDLDENTDNPGVNSFEKMISGGYLGELLFRTLRKAADEKLFNKEIAKALKDIPNIETRDLNDFLISPEGGNILADLCAKEGADSRKIFYYIALNLVERAAKLSAAALSALCIKSGTGSSGSRPICITAEGSTFYMLKNLREYTLFHLKQYLTEQKGINTKIISVADATIKGAAIAGLS